MTVKPEKLLTVVTPSLDEVSLRDIDLRKIDISPKHRKTAPDFLAALSEDMTINGQITPIDVVEIEDRFRLIHGAARVGARKLQGLFTIRAVVTSGAAFATEASQRLRAIPTQLVRRDLTVLDKAAAVAEWRDLYEVSIGVVRPGPKGNQSQVGTNSDDALQILSEQFAGTFTEAAQRALSLSKMGVFRALKIASIDGSVREAIATHLLADNQAELLSLADASADEQLQASKLVLEGTYTGFIAALAFIQNKPAAPILMPWETFAQRFTRLKEEEQERFFNMNADAIERWWVRRSNR
ncbi:ParB family chromosome partitioning protein [Rhizobium sp. PP-CC-2G-626]|nr:ParB family chromosome partitioning protein [Rhizobium sp. PP-CC-2G-626]